MKVYLDLYYLINYILDITILIGVSCLLKNPINIKRLFIGAFIGSLTILLLFININIVLGYLIKFIISIFMIKITFNKKNYLSELFYFYILSIIVGGFMNLFNIDKYNIFIDYLILIICTPIIIKVIINSFLETKRTNNNKHKIKLNINNKDYILTGIIDTGNLLKDPYKKRSVILLDLDINTDKNTILVPFKTINSNGLIKCFIPDKIVIDDKEISNYLIGITNNKFNLSGVNCILPRDILEEI